MASFSKNAFYNALGVLIYVSLVGTLMFHSNQLFGNDRSFLIPIAMLSLFSLSAAVVGGLVLGKPLMLYMDNKKKEALELFLQTVAWMGGFTIVLLAILVVVTNS